MKAPKNLSNPINQQRRTFIKQSIIAGSGVVALPALMQCSSSQHSALILEPSQIIGLKEIAGEKLLENATWFSGNDVKDGFNYSFPAGSLADKNFITTDMLQGQCHPGRRFAGPVASTRLESGLTGQ